MCDRSSSPGDHCERPIRAGISAIMVEILREDLQEGCAAGHAVDTALLVCVLRVLLTTLGDLCIR